MRASVLDCGSLLQSILDEAIRRQDDATVRRVREILRGLDHPRPPLPFDPNFFADPDDKEDAEDSFDPSDVLPSDFLQDQSAEFAEMLEILRTAPDSLVRKMRKKRPPGMPEFVFDELLAIAKGGPPPPWPPRPAPPRLPATQPQPRKPDPPPDPPTPVPPPMDQNQLNQF